MVKLKQNTRGWAADSNFIRAQMYSICFAHKLLNSSTLNSVTHPTFSTPPYLKFRPLYMYCFKFIPFIKYFAYLKQNDKIDLIFKIKICSQRKKNSIIFFFKTQN